MEERERSTAYKTVEVDHPEWLVEVIQSQRKIIIYLKEVRMLESKLDKQRNVVVPPGNMLQMKDP